MEKFRTPKKLVKGKAMKNKIEINLYNNRLIMRTGHHLLNRKDFRGDKNKHRNKVQP